MGTYIHAWGPQNRPETAVQSYCLRCRRLFLPTRSTVCKFCSTPSARPIVLKLCTHHPQTFVWLGDGLWGCLHACMPVCLYVLHAAYMLQGVHADYSLKRETCRCAGMAYMHACQTMGTCTLVCTYVHALRSSVCAIHNDSGRRSAARSRSVGVWTTCSQSIAT